MTRKRIQFWRAFIGLLAVALLVPGMAKADDPTVWDTTAGDLSALVTTIATAAIAVGIAFLTFKVGWKIVKSFTS